MKVCGRKAFHGLLYFLPLYESDSGFVGAKISVQKGDAKRAFRLDRD